MAAHDFSHTVYIVVNGTGVIQQAEKADFLLLLLWWMYPVLSSDVLFQLFQGGGQPAGDGPQHHLQEGEAPGRETGRALPDSAGDRQRGG